MKSGKGRLRQVTCRNCQINLRTGERKLTAILSADVEGYSRLMGSDEEVTVATLTAYREVMTNLIQQHNGKMLDSPGSNLLAEFASVVDAVQYAVAVKTGILRI